MLGGRILSRRASAETSPLAADVDLLRASRLLFSDLRFNFQPDSQEDSNFHILAVLVNQLARRCVVVRAGAQPFFSGFMSFSRARVSAASVRGQ